MNKTPPQILLADIGGTYARFALANESGYQQLLETHCADFVSLELAIDFYLQQQGVTSLSGACIAAAGPKVNQQIRLTNNPWVADGQALSERFGSIPVQLLNDFEAVAWSLPQLGPEHLSPIGPRAATSLSEKDFTALVVGAGTGLGVAGLIRRAGVLHAIVGEGGHVGFAPGNQLQASVLAIVQQHYDRVIAEHLVSGPGLVNIYSALTQLAKGKGSTARQDLPGPAQIFSLAQSGEDELAQKSVGLFFQVMGQVTGDFALAMGAFDAVFIAGGIVRRHPEMLQASHFRKAFEAKGPYRELMERIPTSLILHPHPGLLGALYCFRRLAGLARR